MLGMYVPTGIIILFVLMIKTIKNGFSWGGGGSERTLLYETFMFYEVNPLRISFLGNQISSSYSVNRYC